MAHARGGRGVRAVECYSEFRKIVKVEKREQLELGFKKGHWEHISPHMRMLKMVKGAYTVFDDNQIMRSAASRAELFADYLRTNVWNLKPASTGPCPEELLNVIMFDDPRVHIMVLKNPIFRVNSTNTEN